MVFLPQAQTDRTSNRNESHENHALRINLSILARTLGYRRDDGMVALFFALETKLLSAYGRLAAFPTGKPDIDQEQKREVR